MDLSNTAELISNMGFPIVCCVALFWFIQKTMAQHQILLADINKSIQIQSETVNRLTELLKEKGE